MHYGNPEYLYALLLVPVLWWLFRRGRNRRRTLTGHFGAPDLMKHLVFGSDGHRRQRKERLLLIGLAGVLFSLSHPQYGEKRAEVRREGIDIVFALDTSLSMLAEDSKPNRLEHAKREIEGALSRLRGDRVGVISFAGSAVPTCPLTIDYGAVRMFLRSVDAWTVPTAGTAIAAAIRNATEMLVEGGTGSRVIVLLTDGEDHEGNVEKEADAAAEAGIRVYTVGLGGSDGELIPVGREYKKDEKGGFIVTKRGDEALEAIAKKTGGRHLILSDQPDALDLVLDSVKGMEKQEYRARTAVVREERYTWFLFPATILLIVEALLSTSRRGSREAWSGRIE